MAYNQDLPICTTAPAEISENFRALKEDKIVAAATATKLETARAINGVAFDGTADITITEVDGKTIATTDQILNGFSNVLVNGTTIHADSQSDTIELEAGTNISLIADTTNEKVTIAVTGQVASAAQADNATNADTATKLVTAHTINGVAFDGSADITITAEANGGNADTATKATSADSATTAESCTGNSATATKLATARTIATTGDVTGVATSFDGSANISIPTTLADSGVTAGSYTSVTVDAKGRVTAGTNPTSLAVSVTGNAATATKLATARTISLAGDATGSTTFDGSGNASITVDVTSADSAVVCTGNAATATKLQTARTINGVSFNGSANIEITTANGGTIATTDQVTEAAVRGKQLFTESGTFTVPNGVDQVWVSLCGGGGAGGLGDTGGNDVYWYGGGGGSGASILARELIVTSGEAITVTVGAGGKFTRGSYGDNGGTTSFGTYLSCAGGGCGKFSEGGASGGAGGSGGQYGSASGGGRGGVGLFGYGSGGDNSSVGKSGMVLVEW